MNRKYGYRNHIARRLLLQYFVSLAGFVIAVVLLTMFMRNICRSFIWQETDPLYILLSWVETYILPVLGIVCLAGWTVITFYFISKPLHFLDETITAAEVLAEAKEEPIILSPVLKNVQDEMNQVRETAIRNARAAKEAEQRKNDLIVYLAHDLKTPLTSVIGYLTLLRDERQISEELREKYLAIALSKAERLEDLINEFFEITRFNLSNIVLEYSRISLNRLLEQLVFEFQPMLTDKQLTCNVQVQQELMLACDVDKIQRVFDNLLRNAVFYSFENSGIQIAVTQADNYIQIEFSNRGNTIPPEKLNHIFEQFYRMDISRASNSGGAGLGLAIAKEIVALHKGTITAESRDETVTFRVALPCM